MRRNLGARQGQRVVKLVVEADGGARGNPGVAAYGIVLRQASNGRVLLEKGSYLGESVTNNVAEYSGLIAGLMAAFDFDAKAEVEVLMDSKLVVSQMQGEWKTKDPNLKRLGDRARSLIAGRSVSFRWVPRSANQAADRLANEAMDKRSTVERHGDSLAGDGADGDGLAGGGADGDGLAGDLPGMESWAGPTVDSLAKAVGIAQAAKSGTQRHGELAGPITSVIMVRHGMSVDTHRDVFAGQTLPGPSLSVIGRQQARAAAVEIVRMVTLPWFGLQQPTVLKSSPTARAMETAVELGQALGLAPEADPGFIEQDFGQWDGLDAAEVQALWPNGIQEWSVNSDYRPGGGESRRQVGQRVKAALERVVREHEGRCVVIASHAVATRAAIGAAIGAPPAAWFSFRLAPGSISVLRFWQAGPTEVVCTNRTTY
jgi:probable phosphoglycerate mutase